MTTVKKTTGATLAMAAAMMLAIAPMAASASSHWGKCVGGNSCKGLWVHVKQPQMLVWVKIHAKEKDLRK